MNTEQAQLHAYHFTNGKELRDGRPLPEVGEWLEHEGEIVWCKSGLYASEHPLDALANAPGLLLHKVTCELVEGIEGDKLVCRRRRIDATIDAKRIVLEYAFWCAQQAQPFMQDQRSLNAVDAVEQYLRGDIDLYRLKKVGDAAFTAASAAIVTDSASAASASLQKLQRCLRRLAAITAFKAASAAIVTDSASAASASAASAAYVAYAAITAFTAANAPIDAGFCVCNAVTHASTFSSLSIGHFRNKFAAMVEAEFTRRDYENETK